MNKKNNILSLPSSKKKIVEKGVVEEGTIGDLKYTRFDRGNIQLTDGVNTFRKDCFEFKAALAKHDYDSIIEGGSFEIPGAGDTDSLVIFKEDGDFKLRLGGKVPQIIVQLRDILGRA